MTREASPATGPRALAPTPAGASRPRLPGRLGLGLMVLLAAAPAAAQDRPTVPPVPLTPAQIETVLRARGYAGIEGLAPDGAGAFRLERATRYGAPVGPLRLDAATGGVLAEPPLNDAQVRTLLRSRGYEAVREIRPSGEALLARAVRAGQEVTLRIDPVAGVVRPAE